MGSAVRTFWWKSVLSKSKPFSFLSAFCQTKQDSVNILTHWPIQKSSRRQVFVGFIFYRNGDFDFTLWHEKAEKYDMLQWTRSIQVCTATQSNPNTRPASQDKCGSQGRISPACFISSRFCCFPLSLLHHTHICLDMWGLTKYCSFNTGTWKNSTHGNRVKCF